MFDLALGHHRRLELQRHVHPGMLSLKEITRIVLANVNIVLRKGMLTFRIMGIS
jgi:hypothetical protein